MTRRERIEKAFNLEQPDRPPILGGWLAAPNHIQVLAGCSEDEYWDDPVQWGIEAERVLGSDGIVGVFVPVARGAYRCVDHSVMERRAEHTEESVLAHIELLNSPEKTREGFDEDAWYPEYLKELDKIQSRCTELEYCPADWEVIPRALWVGKFGYEAAMVTMALHPEAWRKLMRVSAEWARQRAVLCARAIREGKRSRAVFTGEDICSQQGPMASPDFFRREYFPLLEYCFEPLLAAGAKIVWHCDGNYRPIVDDLLATGVSGLQGFQRECGMDIEWIAKRRTRHGDPLLIYGPMSVTQTLPMGTPEDVRAEVRRAMDACRDEASLLFFTSNTMNPDCPLENIRAFWNTVLQSHW